MSDEKNPLIKLFPDSIENAAKNITDAPTKNIGQTMADLWFLIFGGISQAADKRRTRYSVELNKFKEELATSLEKVPEENRKEPSSHIVLSALDESKFCVEEEELRKLFVSLLTASTDSSKTVHPSFASIIRQMSPEDAKLLSFFELRDVIPICDINRIKSGSVRSTLAEHLCLDIPESLTAEQLRFSVSSLVRLGLCEIPFGLSLPRSDIYETAKNTDTYKELLKRHGESVLEIDKKILRLTQTGKLFVTCCFF